eukprot:1139884-Pelagomonas_calceolata.AAC.3
MEDVGDPNLHSYFPHNTPAWTIAKILSHMFLHARCVSRAPCSASAHHPRFITLPLGALFALCKNNRACTCAPVLDQ